MLFPYDFTTPDSTHAAVCKHMWHRSEPSASLATESASRFLAKYGAEAFEACHVEPVAISLSLDKRPSMTAIVSRWSRKRDHRAAHSLA